MSDKKKFEYITKDLRQSIGGGNISNMHITIQPYDEKDNTQVVVTLEMIKRFDIKDIDKASELYEKIQRNLYDLDRVVNKD